MEIHHLKGVGLYGGATRQPQWIGGEGNLIVLILLGLGVLWAAVLVPPLLRREGPAMRPVGSLSAVARFDANGLRSLHQSAKAVPSGASAARRRRRDVLVALAGVATFTLLGAVAVGGILWMIHFLVDIALVGYAVMLTNRHQNESERRATVVPLRPSNPFLAGEQVSVAMTDEAVLRRQAN
ncbi:MAG: hypothetical protein CL516_03705 [Actinobacteria bacterium]|nr:hypothetical protein [Actinomycetota bacterium]